MDVVRAGNTVLVIQLGTDTGVEPDFRGMFCLVWACARFGTDVSLSQECLGQQAIQRRAFLAHRQAGVAEARCSEWLALN